MRVKSLISSEPGTGSLIAYIYIDSPITDIYRVLSYSSYITLKRVY